MSRTKNRAWVLLVAGLLAAPAGLSVTRHAGAQDEEPAGKEVADLDTALAKQMEVLEEGMKKLRRTLRKPDQNKESLEWISKMQQAAVASKAEVPAMAMSVPEGEREKFVTGYRKDMAAMIAQTCEMEIALLDGNNDKAMELHKKLKVSEDAGHEKYTK